MSINSDSFYCGVCAGVFPNAELDKHQHANLSFCSEGTFEGRLTTGRIAPSPKQLIEELTARVVALEARVQELEKKGAAPAPLTRGDHEQGD